MLCCMAPPLAQTPFGTTAASIHPPPATRRPPSPRPSASPATHKSRPAKKVLTGFSVPAQHRGAQSALASARERERAEVWQASGARGLRSFFLELRQMVFCKQRPCFVLLLFFGVKFKHNSCKQIGRKPERIGGCSEREKRVHATSLFEQLSLANRT